MTSPLSTSSFDAVLLISFGGPKGLADIRPFLANVLKDRHVPPQRIEEVVHHYELFDGVSPLTELTMRQAAGLRARLDQNGPSLPVYVGMRNWHPYLTDTIREMATDGIKRAVALVLAPHRSYSSCEQYRRNVLDARRELSSDGYPDVQMFYVGDWHTHQAFANAVASRIRTAVEELPPSVRDHARLVFTAHSIPLSMARTSPYHDQLKASAKLVAANLGHPDWALVFQSRSGRPEDPWLEPDICDYLRTERAAGLSAVVLCPIGFVADHIEVLYDLDYEAAGLCSELGITMRRAAAVNDDPLFISMLADVIRETAKRYEHGRPLTICAPDDHRIV